MVDGTTQAWSTKAATSQAIAQSHAEAPRDLPHEEGPSTSADAVLDGVDHSISTSSVSSIATPPVEDINTPPTSMVMSPITLAPASLHNSTGDESSSSVTTPAIISPAAAMADPVFDGLNDVIPSSSPSTTTTSDLGDPATRLVPGSPAFPRLDGSSSLAPTTTSIPLDEVDNHDDNESATIITPSSPTPSSVPTNSQGTTSLPGEGTPSSSSSSTTYETDEDDQDMSVSSVTPSSSTHPSIPSSPVVIDSSRDTMALPGEDIPASSSSPIVEQTDNDGLSMSVSTVIPSSPSHGTPIPSGEGIPSSSSSSSSPISGGHAPKGIIAARAMLKTFMDNEAGFKSAHNGLNVLMALSHSGKSELVFVLLEMYGRENCGINEKDPNGRTALWFASYGGHCDVIKVLLEYHADCSLLDQDGVGPVQIAMEQLEQATDDDGRGRYQICIEGLKVSQDQY